MQVKEILQILEEFHEDTKTSRGLGNPHSYRGYYKDIAFEEVHLGESIGSIKDTIKSVIGKTYQGWKGGDFTMNTHVDCYIADEGNCGKELTRDFIELIILEAKDM